MLFFFQLSWVFSSRFYFHSFHWRIAVHWIAIKMQTTIGLWWCVSKFDGRKFCEDKNGGKPIQWKWINMMIDRFIFIHFPICVFPFVGNQFIESSFYVEWCSVHVFHSFTTQKPKQNTHSYYVMINSTRLSSSLSLLCAIVFSGNSRNWFVSFLEAVCAHARALTHFSQTVKSAKLICFVIRFESRSILDCIMASFGWRLCRCVLCAAKWRWLNC